MIIAPARLTALKALTEIRRRQGFSRPLVDSIAARSGLSPQDAAFAVRLVYTVMMAEGVLDEVIDGFAKRPGAVEPKVRDVLRMSIGEMLYLSTPSRAAVHQGVECVRRVRPAAAGFANAVLRKVSEMAEKFPWGDPAADRDALARACATPRWLVDRFLEDLGEEHGRAALLSHIDVPPLFVRVNPFRATREECLAALTADGADPQGSPPDDDCLVCASSRNAVHGSALQDGMALVSDAAAQVAPLACRPAPGMHILDVGAGRGTKTAMLQGISMRHGGPSHVTAVDIHGFKLEELTASLQRLGVPVPQTAVLDASDADALSSLGESYDAVLVDAPCSGLGTLRRHPEKRWRLTPSDIERVAGLQASLLESAARVVRPGGVVVYSTCTITLRENDDVVGGFLDGNAGAGFKTGSLADVIAPSWERFITPEGWFRSWPESEGADGHFVAVLVRSNA